MSYPSKPMSPRAKLEAKEWVYEALQSKIMSDYAIIGILMTRYALKTDTAARWLDEVRRSHQELEAQK